MLNCVQMLTRGNNSNLFNMRKHLFLTCALVLGLMTSAFSAEKYTYTYTDEGGELKRIYLELNTTTKEATVVSGEWEYTGIIVIPDEVEYPEGSGTKYQITTIGKGGDATQANSPFYYCYDLDEVVFGANVTTIKKNAFYRCGTDSRPVKVHLESDGLTTIETNAFNQIVLRANSGDNTILLGKNITQFGPASATSTDNWHTWGNMINVTAFKVADDNTSFSTDENGVLYNSDKTTLISFPKYRNTTTFEIPASVTTVRSYAFYKMNKLRTVTGGNKVVRLGSVISGLTSLHMGKDLTTMSSSAFMYCGESFVPDIDPSNTTFKLIENVLFKYETDPVKVTLCWFLRGNKTEHYVIPSDVTDIPYGAFYPNAYLKTIEFPKNTKLDASHIDKDAFIGTVNTIEFTGDGVSNIYNNVDGVWYSSDYKRLEMYGENVALEHFVMQDATTTLPRSAVKKNVNVKTIEFNKNLTSFDSQDFYKWENLEEYRVKTGNSKMWADEDGVLYNSAKTKVIAYPRGNTRAYYRVIDGTTNIGTYAFYLNKHLMALDLGDDIQSVVESNCNNLAGMKQLKAIKVGTMVPPTVTTSTFSNDQITNGNIILYVPKKNGAVKIYENASIWNRFKIVHDVDSFDYEIRQIPVDYTVRYLLQNADNDEYTVEETNPRKGSLLDTVEITAKTGDIYDNYEVQPFDPKLILNNRGITFNIYYHSKPFTITWMNGSSQISTKTYRYRAHFYDDIPDDPEPVAGQHFVGWGATADATVTINFSENDKVTKNATYYAIFADNESKPYVVRHYKENADDDGYTIADTVKILAPFGLQTNAVANTYEGFLAPGSIEQKEISKDTTTIVSLYYTRIKYPVTWICRSETITEKSGNFKYGSTLDVPGEQPHELTERFLGWNTVEGATSALTVDGQTVPLGGVTYYAVFVPTDFADYTIKHVLQNLDGSYDDNDPADEVTGNGQIDLLTTATAKNYTGFTSPADDDIEQQTISENGATVIIHYTRNRYDVVWKNGDDVFQTDEDVLFGKAIIELKPETDPEAEAGKHFVGWNTDKTAPSGNLEGATVPAQNTIYYAIFADNAKKPYVVYHKKENADDNEYTLADTEDGLAAPFGTQTKAVAKSYEGFTVQPFNQQTIKEDGTTIVEIKYNRNIHKLTWYENDGNAFTGNYTTGDVKYGATITAPTATREGHTLFGWNTSTDPTQTVTVATTMPDYQLTYYAIWQVNQYHAAYYYNNPEHPAPGKDGSEFTGWNYDFDEKITAPTFNPQPEHYDGFHDFVGWSKTADGSNMITNGDFGRMTTKGAKFYAIWQIHTHQLSWDVNGGDALVDNGYTRGEVAYNTDITAPDYPTREGYTFKGWATELDGTPSFDVDETMPDYELTYHAIWEINQYSISWNANGGQLISDEDDYTHGEVDYDTDIVAPNDPTLYGFDFVGWNTSADAKTAIDVASKMPANDLTYFAIWKEHEHNLTWNANGGIFVDENRNEIPNPSGKVKFGTPITVPQVNRDGYNCAGWGPTANTSETDATEPALTMPDNDLTYFAIWSPKGDNEIKWKYNDGTERDDFNFRVFSNVVTDADIVPPTENPTFEHHKFIGWAATPDGEVLTNFGKMDSNKKKFYAQWELNKNTLAWDANGGTILSNGTTGNVEFDTPLTPATAERTGYTFKGWALSSTATVDDTVKIKNMPDAPTIYYAVWAPKTYDVVWKYNNGTDESFDTTKVVFGQNIVAPKTNPTRDYHRFIGWSEISNAEVATEDLGTLETEGATFYAIWQLRKFKLAWDANGGELSGEYTQGEVAYGTEIIAPTATMENYIFGGWGTIYNPDLIVNITTMPDSSITFVANWTPSEYAVEWRLNNGTDNNYISTTVNYGETIVAPETDPEREHYQFVGWAKDANGYVLTDFGTMTSKHEIFYAQWLINSHTLAWNGNGGELSGEYTDGLVEYDSVITAPTATRTGYTFNGWGTYAEAPHSVDVSRMPDANVEYFAIWNVNNYIAKWHFDHDSVFASLNVNYGDTIKAPSAMPVREQFTFQGWAATETGSVIDSFGLMTAADTAFFAVWEEIEVPADKFAVLWKLNDSTATVFKTDSIAEGDTIKAPAENPVREQFTFLGWAATETGSVIDSFGLMAAADTAFFAIWEAVEDTTVIPETFVVTWFINNGTDSVFAKTALAENDSIVAPAENPIRGQFSFLGWAATENGSAIDSFGLMPAADTAFYAVWEEIDDTIIIITPVTFVATWFMNNGTDSVFTTSLFAENDSIVTPAQIPDREGYSFLGWSTETAGTLVAEFGTITSDTAFYAVWLKETCLVSWMFEEDSVFKTDTLFYGDAIIAPAVNPEREQYTFKGWAMAGDSVIVDFGTAASNITSFYAVWEEITVPQYRAVWYFNDGTNSAFTTTIVSLDATITAPTSNPKRDDYVFKGWSKSATGSVTTNFGTMTANGAAFYAVWEALVSFTAPETFNTCESGSDHIELKDINNSQITFEWNVNGDIDSTQTDGYFEFTEEMALSGTIEVTGILGDTRVTKTINYQRNKDMMRIMWDDVITVVNGKGYFESYRWYRNGVLVDTTDMHYEMGGLTGTYKLVATTVDSLEIASCEMTFGDNEYVSISAYPNPVVNTVLVKGSDVKIGNRISIVDSDGKVRMTKDITDENGETINMSNLPQGVYIVKVGTQSVSIIKL